MCRLLSRHHLYFWTGMVGNGEALSYTLSFDRTSDMLHGNDLL